MGIKTTLAALAITLAAGTAAIAQENEPIEEIGPLATAEEVQAEESQENQERQERSTDEGCYDARTDRFLSGRECQKVLRERCEESITESYEKLQFLEELCIGADAEIPFRYCIYQIENDVLRRGTVVASIAAMAEGYDTGDWESIDDVQDPALRHELEGLYQAGIRLLLNIGWKAYEQEDYEAAFRACSVISEYDQWTGLMPEVLLLKEHASILGERKEIEKAVYFLEAGNHEEVKQALQKAQMNAAYVGIEPSPIIPKLWVAAYQLIIRQRMEEEDYLSARAKVLELEQYVQDHNNADKDPVLEIPANVLSDKQEIARQIVQDGLLEAEENVETAYIQVNAELVSLSALLEEANFTEREQAVLRGKIQRLEARINEILFDEGGMERAIAAYR